MKLTVKQQKFANEYIISGNAGEAARKAGYSEKTAYQMGAENLKKPYIKDYINSKLKKLESDKIDSQKDVLEFLTAVRKGEITEQVVTNKGEVITVPLGGKDRIKAAELLGKRYGTWVEKHQVDGDLNISIGVGDSYEDN